MSEYKTEIIKFGSITEGADGQLIFSDFSVNIDDPDIGSVEALIMACINRLEDTLKELRRPSEVICKFI